MLESASGLTRRLGWEPKQADGGDETRREIARIRAHGVFSLLMHTIQSGRYDTPDAMFSTTFCRARARRDKIATGGPEAAVRSASPQQIKFSWLDVLAFESTDGSSPGFLSFFGSNSSRTIARKTRVAERRREA
jgi:hypothetical protein